MTTPGWFIAEESCADSGPPQEFEISSAPSAAAVFSALKRLKLVGDAASTSVIWHGGQTAWAASMSSEISRAQPSASLAFLRSPPVPLCAFSSSCSVFGKGSGLLAPSWLTCLKHPPAVVHCGRPNSSLYSLRSCSAVGSLYASTIAIVCVEGGELGSW